MSGLVSGLQNRVRRFESARNLSIPNLHSYKATKQMGIVFFICVAKIG